MRRRTGAVLLLVLAVVLSGCLTVNMRAELHRDKSMDFSIGVDSQYEFVRNMMENAITKQFNNGSATLSESSNSFKYTWERVRPPEIDGPTTNNLSKMLDWNVSHNYSFPVSYVYRIEFTTEGMNLSGMENLSGSEGSDSSLGSSLFGGGLSSLGFNFYLDPFGSITDTNGIRTDTGAVKFDLLKDKTYYVEFKDHVWNTWIANLGGPACQEQWSCGEWSACTNGTKTRDCTASNKCSNYLYRPKETKECGVGADSGLGFGDTELGGDTGYGFNSCYRTSPSFIGTPFELRNWTFEGQSGVTLQFAMDEYTIADNVTIRDVTLSFEEQGNVSMGYDRTLTPDNPANITVSGIDWLSSGDCASAKLFVTYDTPDEPVATESGYSDIQGEVP
ncbi:MAG: hypothetical protein SV186_05535 [Candidatus Nanohaloarchaea archaeon]|nr:hypothetical protein [Candidatus Nanohaloarchaea archaeon]